MMFATSKTDFDSSIPLVQKSEGKCLHYVTNKEGNVHSTEFPSMDAHLHYEQHPSKSCSSNYGTTETTLLSSHVCPPENTNFISPQTLITRNATNIVS